MKSRFLLAAAVLFAGAALGLLARPSRADVKVQPGDPGAMRKKLEHGQKLLEGLALENFDTIKTSARELSLISLDALWSGKHSPQYQQLSGEFRTATEKVAKMAEAKNLEGAALNYMQVVMSCVECHKLIRGKEGVASAQ